MESFHYSDLLLNLRGLDAWLTALGLTPRPNDRIHRSIDVLRRAEEVSRKGRQTGIYSEIQPGDWFSIIEALEAHDVFLAFRSDPSPAIPAALKRALSGPLHPVHENHRNRDGRNIWFEFALAAEWRLRGASVPIAEPDLRLKRDDVQFLIACKRPATIETVERNLRDAVSQLSRNLDKSPSGCFGIPAISLTCVLNPGDKVLSGGVPELGTIVNNVLDQHLAFLNSVNDSRICLGWTPRLRQPNKTLFAVRCKIVDRQDHCTAF